MEIKIAHDLYFGLAVLNLLLFFVNLFMGITHGFSIGVYVALLITFFATILCGYVGIEFRKTEK